MHILQIFHLFFFTLLRSNNCTLTQKAKIVILSYWKTKHCKKHELSIGNRLPIPNAMQLLSYKWVKGEPNGQLNPDTTSVEPGRCSDRYM